MNITLRPETQKRINESIRRGEFDSADAFVEQAVTFFLEYEDGEMDEAEFLEVTAAVEKGFEQADRVEGIPLAEFDQTMRAKYGIQR
jgi:Arc/MetJ-type ribon-helix-helix transcriptional regulator